MKTGIELISEERKRQVEKEGWTSDHDDKHDKSELAHAATCYLNTKHQTIIQGFWPWDKKWWKPSENRIRNLVKAGALIAAEIDRLLRLEQSGD
jgi:hypothetical protein